MDPLPDVLRRLLASIPDVPPDVREEIVRTGEPAALLALFQRRAGETLKVAQERHRAVEALIRRP